MAQAIYELWFSFFLYAFLGWCGEVCFNAVKRRIFVNCGVLSGPVCPIYGVGACLVIACLNPLKAHPVFLFAGAVALTSVLEFITGYLLERIFHAKWWDYTGKPGSLAGYVCLPMSLLWGAACLVVVYGVQTLAMWLWSLIPMQLGWSILGLFTAVLLADIVVTTGHIMQLRRLAQVAAELKAAMLKTSDTLGERLAGLRERLDGRMKEKDLLHLAELSNRYHRLKAQRGRTSGRRLTRAFPRLKQHTLFESADKVYPHRVRTTKKKEDDS